MCEAGIQIFHLGSDVIPAETRGCVSSGFAHGSREVEVGGQPADGRTEWLWIPRLLKVSDSSIKNVCHRSATFRLVATRLSSRDGLRLRNRLPA
jgi:hypothetical protein